MAGASQSILFVCWGNTCRSVMAEALAKRRYGKVASFESAGLYPQKPEDSRAALETLKYEFGIDLDHHEPRDLSGVDLSAFSHVIAMDREIANELRDRTSRDIVIWDINDPWEGDPADYKRSALQTLRSLAEFMTRIPAENI